MKQFILNLVKKYLLPKHAFLSPDLIRRKNNHRAMLEVEMVAYTKDLKPLIIARDLASNRLISITGNDHHDYEEHKAKAPGSQTFDTALANKMESKFEVAEQNRINNAINFVKRLNGKK